MQKVCNLYLRAKKLHSRFLFFIFFLCLSSSTVCNAQFCGPVGSMGCTAIHKDSSVIKAWATQCTVTRGYINIADTILGYAIQGGDTNGTKAANNSVVSLGDGGTAILQFAEPISNVSGFDFAIFENAFIDKYLELAFVEVSSDGIYYFRFPATSNTPTTVQIGATDSFGDASKLNNLAGKYGANYGTPFDLEEMKNISGLDVNHITHIKIVDVVGSIDSLYGSFDKNNNRINDPYPTPFPSGGFDLDAVAVLNANSVSTNNTNVNNFITIYPNPCENIVHIQAPNNMYTIVVFDMLGNALFSTKSGKNTMNIDTHTWKKGVYFLHIKDSNDTIYYKKVIKG